MQKIKSRSTWGHLNERSEILKGKQCSVINFMKESQEAQVLYVRSGGVFERIAVGINDSDRLHALISDSIYYGGTNEEESNKIKKIVDNVIELSKEYKYLGEAYFSIICVLYYDYDKEEANAAPLFKFHVNLKNHRKLVNFFDLQLKRYHSWNEFLDSIRLNNFLICVPRDGSYDFLSNDSLDLVYVCPKNSSSTKSLVPLNAKPFHEVVKEWMFLSDTLNKVHGYIEKNIDLWDISKIVETSLTILKSPDILALCRGKLNDLGIPIGNELVEHISKSLPNISKYRIFLAIAIPIIFIVVRTIIKWFRDRKTKKSNANSIAPLALENDSTGDELYKGDFENILLQMEELKGFGNLESIENGGNQTIDADEGTFYVRKSLALPEIKLEIRNILKKDFVLKTVSDEFSFFEYDEGLNRGFICLQKSAVILFVPKISTDEK